MSSYQEDLEKREAALVEQQLENTNQLVWTQILRLYPLADHQANYKAVKEYCDPLPISVSAFRMLMDNPQAAATLDLADDSQRTISEIIRLLREHGKYTEHDLKTHEKKLRTMTREAQRARLAEVRSKQAQAKLSVPELKQIVREGTTQTRRYPGYPNLPDMLVPPGQVQAVKCDAAYLLGLAKNDFYEYKRMVARFSAEQITARQRGEI